MDLSDQRVTYDVAGIDIASLSANPFAQFRTWFDEAVESGEGEPYAMVLSTADEAGQPRGRNVLLRAVDHGFVFYTNYTSTKAKALDASGLAGITFSWLLLHRQVQIEGTAERASVENPTPISPSVHATVNWAHGLVIRAARFRIEVSSNPALSRSPSASRVFRSRAHRSGAGIGLFPSRSSSGKDSPADSTTEFAMSEAAETGLELV